MYYFAGGTALERNKLGILDLFQELSYIEGSSPTGIFNVGESLKLFSSGKRGFAMSESCLQLHNIGKILGNICELQFVHLNQAFMNE